VIGTSSAGHPFTDAVGKGEAVRIFTGAVLPEGADTVIIQENASFEEGGGTVIFHELPSPAANVRQQGIDFNTGDTPLLTGKQITARDIGLLAAMNVSWLQVYRKPVVAVLSTGDEVKLPGEALGSGDIISSNGPALAALFTAWGCEVRNLGVARDDEQSLVQAFGAAAGADLLVSTGGVSVGAHDLVKTVLEQQAALSFGAAGKTSGLEFWKVAMRPGKPLMFGWIGALPVLGLPGNPVSALTCTLLFGWSACCRLRGLAASGGLPMSMVELATDLPENGPREHYIRARVTCDNGKLIASPHTNHDSSLMRLLSEADALLLRPVGADAAPRGTLIPAIILSGIPGF